MQRRAHDPRRHRRPTIVVDLLRHLEPADRPDGRRLDPAHADGAPDDRHRPGAALRRRQGDDRVPDRPRHGRRTCTSARRARASRSAPTPTGRSSIDPEDIPSIEESALTPTELPFTAGRLRPAAGARARADARDRRRRVGRREVRDQRAAVGDRRRHAAARRDARGQGPLVGGRGVDQGGPGHRQDRRRADRPRRVRDRRLRLRTSRACYSHQKATGHVVARASRGLQQDVRDRPPRRAVGVRPPRAAARRSTSASRRSARCSSRPPAGSGRSGTSPTRSLLEEYGDRVTRREAEWESRWWSPIINAEHLAMRDRAGDGRPVGVRDVRRHRSRRARRRPALAMRQMDVAVGRVVYTPLLTPSGGFRQDLTIMRLDDDRFRVVTGGAYGMSRPQVVHATTCPRTARRRSTTRPAPGARSACGARGRATSSSIVTADDVSHEGFPFATLRGRSRSARAGAGLADLLRRRPRLGAVRADRAGRAAVGHRRRGRRSRTASIPVGHRRLRHHRAAREGLPRLRRRARGRVQRRRGRDGLGQGQGRRTSSARRRTSRHREEEPAASCAR